MTRGGKTRGQVRSPDEPKSPRVPSAAHIHVDRRALPSAEERGSAQAAATAALNARGADWVLARAEVARWFEHARVGEKLIYAGGRLIQGETSLFVRTLYLEGEATLLQPRSASGGGFDYILQKRATAKAEAAPIAAAEADEAQDVILRRLKRCANLNMQCPSDAELAREAGLATRARAAWRLRKLEKAGTIKTRTTGDVAVPRVVTIVATGKQTKVPSSWAAFRRAVKEEIS